VYPYAMLDQEANLRVRYRLAEAERDRLAAAARRHALDESPQTADCFISALLRRIRGVRSIARPRLQASWRLGDLEQLPDGATGPFALEVVGRWREASAEWLALGCPYEAALASINGGESEMREAMRVLEGLGATRSVEAVARRLREKSLSA
jgi:hypothetical protein